MGEEHARTVEDALAVLRSEFGADDDSFLLRLRIELEWDRAAFARMETAMRVVCESRDHGEASDQWLADGFRFVSTWVDGHSAHPGFPRAQPESYYAASLDRLRALSDWFLHGVRADQDVND